MDDDAFEYVVQVAFPKPLLQQLRGAARVAGIRTEQLIIALLWIALNRGDTSDVEDQNLDEENPG